VRGRDIEPPAVRPARSNAFHGAPRNKSSDTTSRLPFSVGWVQVGMKKGWLNRAR
jgi:hypothetical protein